MMFVRWTLALVTVLAFTAPAAAQPVVRDSATSISLEVPQGWIATSRHGFVSVRLEEPDGMSRFLVSILVEELAGQRVRIDQYKRIMYETHYEHYGAPERWVQRDTTFRGMPAFVVDFSYPYGGDGEEILVRRIVAFRDRTAFLISAEAREERWPELLQHYTAMLRSLSVPK